MAILTILTKMSETLPCNNRADTSFEVQIVNGMHITFIKFPKKSDRILEIESLMRDLLNEKGMEALTPDEVPHTSSREIFYITLNDGTRLIAKKSNHKDGDTSLMAPVSCEEEVLAAILCRQMLESPELIGQLDDLNIAVQVETPIAIITDPETNDQFTVFPEINGGIHGSFSQYMDDLPIEGGSYHSIYFRLNGIMQDVIEIVQRFSRTWKGPCGESLEFKDFGIHQLIIAQDGTVVTIVDFEHCYIRRVNDQEN